MAIDYTVLTVFFITFKDLLNTILIIKLPFAATHRREAVSGIEKVFERNEEVCISKCATFGSTALGIKLSFVWNESVSILY